MLNRVREILNYVRFKRNKYIFNHYVLPCFTVEELSKLSSEKLSNFYFFFTKAKFISNAQRLFFKRLKKGQILLILYDEKEIHPLFLDNLDTLVLNRPMKREGTEVEQALKQFKKKIENWNKKQDSRNKGEIKFKEYLNNVAETDSSKLEDIEKLVSNVEDLVADFKEEEDGK